MWGSTVLGGRHSAPLCFRRIFAVADFVPIQAIARTGQAVDEEELRVMTNEMMFEAAVQLEAENASRGLQPISTDPAGAPLKCRRI